MNNKGFMMAEVVVVSAIIVVTLTSLYVSHNKIFSIYNQRVDYYDITTLYELADVRKNTNTTIHNSKDLIINETYKKVYYVHKDDVSNLNVINETFKDYLEYISDSVTFETDYILIMERCVNNNIDDCKYAYLEVF